MGKEKERDRQTGRERDFAARETERER